MKFGFAEADISPRDGVTTMSGYGRRRYAQGVVSPLMLSASVIEDDQGHRHALIAADLLGFDRSTTEIVRHRLAQAGFEPERVMLNASHTHYGPPTQFSITASVGPLDPWYVEWMEARTLETVQAACESLADSEIRHGCFRIKIGWNRRLKKDGRITMTPNPDGSYDEHSTFLWIRPADKARPEVVLLAHGCHPVHSRAEGYGADYPGEFRRHGAARRPGCRFVFLQGCGADVNGPGKDQYVAEGERLAEELIRQLREETTLPVRGAFSCAIHETRLPFGRRFSRRELEDLMFQPKAGFESCYAREQRRCPDMRRSLPYTVQAWRCGDFSIAGLEGEVVCAYGPFTRGLAGGECMVLGYTNAVECYVPTGQILKEGGYEAVTSCRCYRLPAVLSKTAPAAVEKAIQRALRLSKSSPAAGLPARRKQSPETTQHKRTGK